MKAWWKKIVVTSLAVVAIAASTAGAAEKTLAEELLTEVNLARTEPHRYAAYIKELRNGFEGKVLRLNLFTLLQTSEGTPALDEAIGYLSRQKPLPSLRWSTGLAKAAADLVRDEGETGAVGHTGSRCGGLQQRVEKHGNWERIVGEIIGYGPRTARMMVMQLIIDDGVGNRGHRKNIFTKGFAVAGAACGSHPVYEMMCVMDFAGGFRE